jgi:N-acetylglucosaminyldiphosphoundecaprenol N-acetyl-beta-D-mannosaminyltransferase
VRTLKSDFCVSLRRVDFLGVPLCFLTTGEFIECLISETLARRGKPNAKPFFVTYLNAACSNISAHDEEYRRILHKADIVYADGQAIVWASRWLKAGVPERVNAADFFLEFCKRAADENLSLYLLGSALGVAPGAASRFVSEVPHLNICGADSGYFTDDEEVLERIRNASPDILIVGMGVPRQEKWVFRNIDKLDARSVWCVGALFEYYSGYRLRAPVWMRKAGLEWLFRLVLEPKRLWRRYLIGNAVFLWRVATRVWANFS